MIYYTCGVYYLLTYAHNNDAKNEHQPYIMNYVGSRHINIYEDKFSVGTGQVVFTEFVLGTYSALKIMLLKLNSHLP